MAGPNLEVFKFGLYLFFPLAVMVHYGDPDWYRQHVLPIRDQFWPKENTLFRPPRNPNDLKSTLEEMKEQRLARRDARLRAEQGGDGVQAASRQSSRTVSKESSASIRHATRTADWAVVDRQRLV